MYVYTMHSYHTQGQRQEAFLDGCIGYALVQKSLGRNKGVWSVMRELSLAILWKGHMSQVPDPNPDKVWKYYAGLLNEWNTEHASFLSVPIHHLLWSISQHVGKAPPSWPKVRNLGSATTSVLLQVLCRKHSSTQVIWELSYPTRWEYVNSSLENGIFLWRSIPDQKWSLPGGMLSFS